MFVGKLFKWLQLCIRLRKDEITFRKVQWRRAFQNRDNLIQKEQERQLKMEQDVAEAE